MSSTAHPDKPAVLLSPEVIAARVAELGQAITADKRDEDLVVISVLKGSFMFAADLIRQIDLPLTMEFMGTRSYGNGTETSGEVQITSDLSRPIEGKDVLLIEDIVDTGLTLSFVLDLLARRGPRSLKLAALLHKPSRTRVPVKVDYLGFSIDDVFVVGYGLDHAQRYRNLPYVGFITP
jgi:hypoxanthine phosphoribosyltransferase